MILAVSLPKGVLGLDMEQKSWGFVLKFVIMSKEETEFHKNKMKKLGQSLKAEQIEDRLRNGDFKTARFPRRF